MQKQSPKPDFAHGVYRIFIFPHRLLVGRDEDCVLVAEGTVIPNIIHEGSWSAEKIKWCCRLNRKTFRHEKII